MSNKCNGCGKCCESKMCEIGKHIYKTKKFPCPGLLYENGRYWCKIIKCMVKDKDRSFLESHMTIGFGCEWNEHKG